MKGAGTVVVATDPSVAEEIERLCEGSAALVRWKTTSVASALEIVRKFHPSLAVVALGSAVPATLAYAIESLARESSSLYILAVLERTDGEAVMGAMRAGAHDVVPFPLLPEDFSAAIDKFMKARATRTDAAPSQGKIVSVFSNKGGNGGTTLACNLADALAGRHGKKTAVVDLVLSHGDVSTFFNVQTEYSLLDLVKNAEKADYDFLHGLLVRHSSGVYVLADPPSVEEAEGISASQVRSVLNTMRSLFDYIVVDTPHAYDERTMTALELSDTILLVSLLNLPSLRNTQRCLDLFDRVGLRDDRVRLVLNRFMESDDISVAQVEQTLGQPIFSRIPNDYPAVISSINRGRLLREVAPDAEVTAAFGELSDGIVGKKSEPRPPAKRSILDRIFRAERTAP
jgi:pilus assembly protein CpaE